MSFVEGFKAKCVKHGSWIEVGENYPIIDVGLFKICVVTPRGNFWHWKGKFTPIINTCPTCHQELTEPLPEKSK